MTNHASTQKRKTLIRITLILTIVGFAIAALLSLWRKWRAAKRPPERKPPWVVAPERIQGLTEAEAAARRQVGQDNIIHFHPPRTIHQIWKDNTFTIFNLNLIGLAIAQLLLHLPIDALLSIGVMFLNIIVNMVQELFARKRLEKIERSTRPQATVIREGKVRSIDPSEIVREDALVVGPGDQFLADGEIIGEGEVTVDESMLTGKSGYVIKRPGDTVLAGSACITGRGVYRAQVLGDERLIVKLVSKSQSVEEELTPLEQVVGRVLRVLLGVVAILSVLLITQYLRLNLNIGVDAIKSASSVIFSIAPSGLFFMIFLTYAGGTADIARIGALVHRARSVESLAHTTALCFAKTGILTGTQVEIEPLDTPDNQKRLADSRIQQILGDMARSTSVRNNQLMSAIAETFDGDQRTIHEEAPFMSVYGWSAITFDDDDLRGVYILGSPEILESHLVTKDEQDAGQAEKEAKPPAWKKITSPLGRLFRKTEETAPKENTATQFPQSQSDITHPPAQPEKPSEEGEGEIPPPETEPSKTGFFKRTFGKVTQAVKTALPARKAADEDEAQEELAEPEGVTLLFAYHPDVIPLHDDDLKPQLPDNLIPLSTLRYTETIHPEALETITSFSASGVAIKIFSPGDSEQIITLFEQAGVDANTIPLPSTSGSKLVHMGPEELKLAAMNNTVFGNLTPEQARLIVQALRDQEQTVAVIGDRVADLPPMRQANLSISRRSSSQSVLAIADMVLLENSPKALMKVLEKGQRIVNGLLSVLKLYLTQVSYLALLIVSLWVTTRGFPYQTEQGTAISTITLTIPSIGLTFWAAAGVLRTTRYGKLLARFVVPAAVTTSLVAIIVYRTFLERAIGTSYAQLGVTYTLVAIGLLLVIFTKPPWRKGVDGKAFSGDWRPTLLALALFIIFLVLPAIPLARKYLLVDWLRQPADYLFVGFAALVWAITLQIVWRVMPPEMA